MNWSTLVARVVRSLMVVAIAPLNSNECKSASYSFCQDENHNSYFQEETVVTSFGVDLLVWHAKQDGLRYGMAVEAINFRGRESEEGFPPFNQVEQAGALLTQEIPLHFTYSPGFRLYGGAQFKKCNTEAIADWTHYHSSAKTGNSSLDIDQLLYNFYDGDFDTSTNSPIQNTILPLNNLLPTAPGINTRSSAAPSYNYAIAQSSWGITYDDVDFLLKHPFCLSETLYLTPHLGLSLVKIKEKWKGALLSIDANPSLFGFERSQLILVIENDNSFRFEGVGIKAGLDLNWQLYSSFYLYGEGHLALYYGQYDLKRTQKETAFQGLAGYDEIAPIRSLVTARFHDRYNDIKLASDLSLGLKWEGKWGCAANEFNVYVAWEAKQYYNQNQFARIGNLIEQETNVDIVDGDLSFTGITVGFKIGF